MKALQIKGKALRLTTRWRDSLTLGAMTRALILLICGLFSGCTPTANDYLRDSDRISQGYLTGDINAVKAALLAEEKLIAEHEARRTRGVDFGIRRRIVYMMLCSVSAHMGHTNDADF